MWCKLLKGVICFLHGCIFLSRCEAIFLIFVALLLYCLG